MYSIVQLVEAAICSGRVRDCKVPTSNMQRNTTGKDGKSGDIDTISRVRWFVSLHEGADVREQRNGHNAGCPPSVKG